MTFKEQIELYLSALPSEWKEKLTAILCAINDAQQTVNCDDVKDCETLTSLSAFSITGSTISIRYKDEHQVTVTRSLDLEDVISSELADLDPGCLTDATTWASMTFIERLQMLIDAQCECCGDGAPRIIPFTNELSSCSYFFDSPPTAIPDNDPLFQHYIKFVGQTGQDNVYVDIPFEESELGYHVPLVGSVQIPGSMSGNYKAIAYIMTGGDYPGVILQNSSNADIGGGGLYSGNSPSLPSGTFDIADLDNLAFTCANSG